MSKGGDRTTGFDMEEEFVGSHIDENGFISFTSQRQPRKLTKEDQIYGIWNQEVEDNVFRGSKQIAKTTLAMNFRKSGLIQHDPDTGVKVKYANNKNDNSNNTQVNEKAHSSLKNNKNNNGKSNVQNQKSNNNVNKKSVRFDEKVIQEVQNEKLKKKQLQSFGFNVDIDPLQFDDNGDDYEDNDDQDDDNDEIKKKMNLKNKYMQMFSKSNKNNDDDEDEEKDNSDDKDGDSDDDYNEDDEDEVGLGFGKKNKNQLFFKSQLQKKKSKNDNKSILKKKQQNQVNIKKGDYDDDLDDINDLDSQEDEDNNEEQYEDQDEKFKYNKNQNKSQSIQLTKDQMRKRKIFNFKRNREDDEEIIIEEQSKQLNLPLSFGQQRKQQKRLLTDQEIEIEAKKVINFETKEEAQESEFNTEKYGKGFEMLKKMGYKVGKGIGKEEQGISKPVEAQFKQSFSMYDDYKQMQKDNKKLLKEQFNIDVEQDLDDFEDAYNSFKSNQSEFADYDDENTLEFEKTYVKSNPNGQKQFPNKFFAHLNKKSRQAKNGSLTEINQLQFNNSKKNKNDLINQNQQNQNINNQKILDMRSGNTITYEINSNSNNNFSEFFAANKLLDAKQLSKTDNPIFSDMLFNLKNKLDKTQSKMMNLQQKLKVEQDRIITVQYEEKQQKTSSIKNSNNMKQTLNLLNQLQYINQQQSNLKSNEIINLFIKLFNGSEHQFIHFNLDQLFVKIITSSFNNHFEQLILNQSILKSTQSNNVDDNNENEIDLQNMISSDEDEEQQFKQLNNKKTKNNNQQQFLQELNKYEVKQYVEEIKECERLLTRIFLYKQNENLIQYENELSGNIHLKRDEQLNEKNSRLISRYVQYIINHSFMPHLKNYMLKLFVITDLKLNNQLIDCLEEYQKILPQSVITDLIQSFILPKINDAVKKWNPNKNDSRNLQGDIDLWLLPWLSIITPIDLLKDTFKLVLAKYSQVLVKWEVQDRSMLEKLKPWKNIISEQQWNDLMLKQIIPKLQYYLDELVINPSEQQDLDILENIVLWCDLLQERDISTIMEDTILVKLAEVLMEWLNSDGIIIEEVQSWLTTWKNLLGKKIMNIPTFSITFDSFFDKIQEL